MKMRFRQPMFRNSTARFLAPFMLFSFLFNQETVAQFWEQTTRPGGSTVNALAINLSGHVFVGTTCCGVYRSLDKGEKWTKILDDLTSGKVRTLAINSSGYIFAGTDNGVFRSMDTGDSWTAVDSGLTNTRVFALAINSSGYIFAGTDSGGVFRSMDNGNSWTSVDTGLQIIDVRTLAIAPLGNIFAGTGGGAFRSTNDGDRWTLVNNEIDVLILAINSSGHIFAGTNGGAIFRSLNNGDNWTEVNSGLTNPFVRALAINALGHIFAGTDGGVFRSMDNGNSWTPVNTGLGTQAVTALAINPSGYIFAGVAGGAAYRSLQSTTYPEVLQLIHTVDYPSLPNVSDYKATDYQIVGLPGASLLSVDDLLPSGSHRKDWQVYWDNGSPSNFFVEFDGGREFDFSVGRAFWIIKKGPLKIEKGPVPAARLDTTGTIGTVTIPLHLSWNLITNPFMSQVSWLAVRELNGITNRIWKFDKATGFSQTDTLKPYTGYYFDNATNKSFLKIPYVLFSSAISDAADLDPAIWRVKMTLFSGEFTDKATSFGVSREASPEIDHLDFRKPRAIATIPSVAFNRSAWDKSYGIFATDIRPEFEEQESWEFEVLSEQREPVKLTFSGINRIPIRFAVYLVDDARARYVNLREDSLYNFTPATDIAKFTVRVGKAEALQDELDGLIPKEFALEQNFPNPFNPTTAIPVTVPATTKVKIKIYNLLGKEVKTLHSSSLEPGRHFFNWDGRDEAGIALGTGVYFYRLTTNTGNTFTQKMLLVK